MISADPWADKVYKDVFSKDAKAEFILSERLELLDEIKRRAKSANADISQEEMEKHGKNI